MPEYLPKLHNFSGLGQMIYHGGLPAAGYVHPNAYSGPVAAPTKQLEAVNGQPTQEDLILAINKLFGTAPVRAVPSHIGVPFLMKSEPGIIPIIPSDEANAKAFKLMQEAKIPQDLDQASQAKMMTDHLQKLGILP